MKPLVITKQITNREDASLSHYLQDIGQISMITAEEEVELTVRIRAGDTLALEKLVTANLRFVVSVAKQYQHRGLKLQDLINEGNLGLMRAALKFDETRGFKFISYAVWWIRQGILQALAENSRIVRLPLNKIAAISKIQKATAHFEQLNQRLPHNDELSDLMDMSATEIEECTKNGSWPLSMDAPLKAEDSDSTLYDLIRAKDSPDPEADSMHASLQNDIDQILRILSDREIKIIKLNFGLENGKPMTLDQIAEELELSKERVRQIREHGLIRIRQSIKAQRLLEYLG